VARPLTDEQVEGLVNSAWGVVSDQASTALAKLPMPAIAGVSLGTPTRQGRRCVRRRGRPGQLG